MVLVHFLKYFLNNILPKFLQLLWDKQNNCILNPYMPSVRFSVGAKLRYMGYFASLLHPPGRKSWLLFSIRDMSGGLRNPCFTKFSVVKFL